MPDFPSSTSGSADAVAVPVAALAASEAACQPHAWVQHSTTAVMQQVWRLPCSIPNAPWGYMHRQAGGGSPESSAVLDKQGGDAGGVHTREALTCLAASLSARCST